VLCRSLWRAARCLSDGPVITPELVVDLPLPADPDARPSQRWLILEFIIMQLGEEVAIRDLRQMQFRRVVELYYLFVRDEMPL
jgi:hypothetical protein